MSRTLIREATAAAVGEATEKGTVPIIVASPGWGSSGHYSPKVLENAATDKIFKQSLHLYMDHPSESEAHDRPERSVRDLVGTLTGDATWDPNLGLVAEAKIFGPYRELFRDEDFANAIGVSLRAYADTTIGEAEGRKGTLITRLLEAESVDFVTKAGRGGRLMAALESARAGRVAEASTEDTRRVLTDTVRGAYGGDDTWVYVQDFDPDAALVWFSVETPDTWSTYQQGYTATDDGAVTLADGDPTPVRARTEYVPITTGAAEASAHQPPVAPAGSTPTHESEEDTMPQIEEGRLAQLEADAGRVQTLESERDTARTERDQARQAEAAATRRSDALAILAEADHRFTALERRGLLAELPATDDGTLDADAFKDAVNEAIAEAEQRSGAGTVRGFGPTTTATEARVSDADLDTTLGIARKGA